MAYLIVFVLARCSSEAGLDLVFKYFTFDSFEMFEACASMNLSKACVRVAHLGMAQTLGIGAKKNKKGGLRTSEKMIDDDR